MGILVFSNPLPPMGILVLSNPLPPMGMLVLSNPLPPMGILIIKYPWWPSNTQSLLSKIGVDVGWKCEYLAEDKALMEQQHEMKHTGNSLQSITMWYLWIWSQIFKLVETVWLWHEEEHSLVAGSLENWALLWGMWNNSRVMSSSKVKHGTEGKEQDPVIYILLNLT